MADLMNDPLWQRSVHRMIRCRQTHRYFKDGDWTENAIEATTYGDEMEAVRACLDHDLNNIELVLRAQGSQADLFCTLIR